MHKHTWLDNDARFVCSELHTESFESWRKHKSEKVLSCHFLNKVHFRKHNPMNDCLCFLLQKLPFTVCTKRTSNKEVLQSTRSFRETISVRTHERTSISLTIHIQTSRAQFKAKWDTVKSSKQDVMLCKSLKHVLS